MHQVAPSVSIPSADWTDADGDGSRLLATIDVNDCSLHMEAFAVGRVPTCKPGRRTRSSSRLSTPRSVPTAAGRASRSTAATTS
jgi:hypothetical protein